MPIVIKTGFTMGGRVFKREVDQQTGWFRLLTDAWLRGSRITLFSDWIHPVNGREDTAANELAEAADKIEGVWLCMD